MKSADMADLQTWRKRNGLTQIDAAALLGVSQPYLSLIEKKARPLTAALQARMKASRRADQSGDSTLRGQLSALGYPGFAHLTRSRSKAKPDALLLSVLSKPDADSRIVDALPWLVRRYACNMDLDWLVRQAKLRDLQNRVGFLLQMAGDATPEVLTAVRELDRARLLRESTLCWDGMPAATREWMRANRTPLAAHWNILTRLKAEDISDDAVA